MSNINKLDTQQIEIIGRNHLVNMLILHDYEIALPLRDTGIDLIAYTVIETDRVPEKMFIQMKSATSESFTINRKYERFSDLYMAYVWHVFESTPHIYLMTYEQALDIASKMGYVNTPSWEEKGLYTSTRPGKELKRLMSQYRK